MKPQKVIIDTDPGIDDAMAIFFAALHPGIELVGLTTVFGNVTADVATRNALVLCERAQNPVPVAKGADVPLVQPPNRVSDYVHGAEGFGDMPPQRASGAPIDESAAEFICRQINQHPGDIVLCPIGPLTNIAHALELDPSIADKVKSVVIMGGGLDLGNVTDYAEANIWNDPHAADAVFAANWTVTVVGLDVTTKVTCDDDFFASLATSSPVLGGFLHQAVDYYLKFYENHYGLRSVQMHDPTAVIAITNPEFFTIENHAVEVIVEGARIGQTVRSTNAARIPAKVCMGVDADAVKDLFKSTIEAGF